MDQAITQWINALAGSNVLLDSVMFMASAGSAYPASAGTAEPDRDLCPIMARIRRDK
jgi:hypothetical protein